MRHESVGRKDVTVTLRYIRDLYGSAHLTCILLALFIIWKKAEGRKVNKKSYFEYI